MHTARTYAIARHKHFSSIYILTFLWTFGLSSGMLLASKARLVTDPWMYAVRTDSVSILSLLILMSIPFLVSFIVFRFRVTIVIHILAFLKSFIYGFSRCIMIHLFFSAGWFANIFLFFSDSILTVILLFYWIYSFQKNSILPLRSDFIYLFIVAVVCIIDYFIVLPSWTAITI